MLTAALRRFARNEGSALDDLIRLLTDLPEDVSQISKATKLAADIADQLHDACNQPVLPEIEFVVREWLVRMQALPGLDQAA